MKELFIHGTGHIEFQVSVDAADLDNVISELLKGDGIHKLTCHDLYGPSQKWLIGRGVSGYFWQNSSDHHCWRYMLAESPDRVICHVPVGTTDDEIEEVVLAEASLVWAK